MAAEVGGGLQIDGQRPRPGGVPFLVGRIVGDAFVDSGIVDQHVDPAAELFQRRLPRSTWRCGIGQVAGDQAVTAVGRMAGNAVAGWR